MRLLGIVVLRGFRSRGGSAGLCLVILVAMLSWLCTFLECSVLGLWWCCSLRNFGLVGVAVRVVVVVGLGCDMRFAFVFFSLWIASLVGFD